MSALFGKGLMALMLMMLAWSSSAEINDKAPQPIIEFTTAQIMIWAVVNSMMGCGALSLISALLDHASIISINAISPLPNNADIFITSLSHSFFHPTEPG